MPLDRVGMSGWTRGMDRAASGVAPLPLVLPRGGGRRRRSGAGWPREAAAAADGEGGGRSPGPGSGAAATGGGLPWTAVAMGCSLCGVCVQAGGRRPAGPASVWWWAEEKKVCPRRANERASPPPSARRVFRFRRADSFALFAPRALATCPQPAPRDECRHCSAWRCDLRADPPRIAAFSRLRATSAPAARPHSTHCGGGGR
jgi:hypothetical protein